MHPRQVNSLFIFAGLLLVASCSEDDPQKPQPEPPDPTPSYAYRVVRAFPDLFFIQPIDIQDPRDGTNRLFVAEQGGIIRVFENSPQTPSSSVFVDLRDRVNTPGSEEGLLSLAFDPLFGSNGHFYVYYNSTVDDSARLSRFTATPPDAKTADPNSEVVILSVRQPARGHNGGQLVFDKNGYLYLSLGDGARSGDPFNNAQDRTTLLGSVIRIDISSLPYSIPDDNPYKGNQMGWREEIYAHGFRNPWRMTIDPVTEAIWVGDVGQSKYEEIDIVKKGKNYGWDCREGLHEFVPGDFVDGPSPLCDSVPEFEDPVWDYSRDVGGSVIGGFVYRGPELTSLDGKYIYSDYISPTIWALEPGGWPTALVEATDPKTTETLSVVSFGLDENGILYLCDHDLSGVPTRIYKLTQIRD